MRTSWHSIWGSGRGPAIKLAPHARLLCGMALLAALLIVPVSHIQGAGLALATCLGWLAGCRPRSSHVRGAIVLGLFMFAPYFLLVPLLPDAETPGGVGWSSLAVPATILLRGTLGVLVCLATVSSLSQADFRDGLLRLPLPSLVSAIILQMIRQTSVLLQECVRMAAAMAVRGATGRGIAPWRVLAALPSVWLPRVMSRAERVASCMEVRGYANGALRASRPGRTRRADAVAITISSTILGVSLVLRYVGPAWLSRL